MVSEVEGVLSVGERVVSAVVDVIVEGEGEGVGVVGVGICCRLDECVCGSNCGCRYWCSCECRCRSVCLGMCRCR